MPLISSDYRGPLVVVAVGAGFLLVGAVPVAVTFSTGVRTSAKVIGVGFVGFGLLLMLPGLCWCVWVRVQAFRRQHWPSSSASKATSGDDATGSMVGVNHNDDNAHRYAPVSVTGLGIAPWTFSLGHFTPSYHYLNRDRNHNHNHFWVFSLVRFLPSFPPFLSSPSFARIDVAP